MRVIFQKQFPSWSCRFFSCKVFFLLFSQWLKIISNNQKIYLLRERPRIYNKFSFSMVSNNFRKHILVICKCDFYHSKYLAFLKKQIYLFLIDDLINVPTWRKNRNNQHKLKIYSSRFPSWNLFFVNIEYYYSVRFNKLRVASQQFASLYHYELRANKFASCGSMNQHVNSLWRCELT